MVVFRLLWMTFGDQSAFLELALGEIVAPICKTALGREILQSNRYVDDGARAHHNKAELHKAMDDVINTLKVCGFDVKHVISEGLSWHKDRGELNKDGSTTDGAFTPDMEVETVFHHSYNFRQDTLAINIDFNLHD